MPKTYPLTLEQLNEIYADGFSRGYWATEMEPGLTPFNAPIRFNEED